MATDFTTAELVLSARRRALVPVSTVALDTNDILQLANDELASNVVPLIISAREEYFLATVDIAFSANQSQIEIPSRSVGGRVRDIWLKYSTDSEFTSTPRVEVEEGWERQSTGRPQGYIVEGDFLTLTPTPATSGVLRVKYFRRPSWLVPTTEAAKITGLTSTVITCATVPTAWTNATTLDVVQGRPPFRAPLEDFVPSAVVTGSSGTITVASTTGLSKGDYVALAGESPIAQIPRELHPYLAQRTAMKLCEALGDAKNMQITKAIADEMRVGVFKTISPRDSSPSRTLINRHGPGFRRGY